MSLKNLVHKLWINRVASVDRGAGEGVQVLLMKSAGEGDGDGEPYWKRDFSEDQRKKAAGSGAALPDGSFPIENTSDLKNAIHAFGRAKDKAKAKAHIISRAKSLGQEALIPQDWKTEKKFTLWHNGKDNSLTIEHDGNPVSDDKKKTLKKVYEGDLAKGLEPGSPAHEAMEEKALQMLEEAHGNLRKGVLEAKGDETKIEKALETYMEFFGKAVTAGIAVSEGADAQITKKEADMADKSKDKEDNQESPEDCAKRLGEELAVAKRELAMAKMTPADRDYFEKALKTDAEKEEFLKADDKVRAEKRAAIKSELPEEIRKSLEEFASMKKQLEDIRKREETATFEKRASDLGFAPAFGETLRKAYSGDAESITKVEKEIVALRKQVSEGSLFKTFGQNTTQTGSAYEALMGKASELRKSDKKLSQAQAFAKVFEDSENAELVKQYRQEQRAN